MLTKKNVYLEKQIIRGIAHSNNETLITLIDIKNKPGISASIFDALSKENINVDAFSSSGDSVLNKIAASSGIIPKKLKIFALILLFAISGYGYFSFTNLETIFEFTDFLPEDDPVVQTLGLLTDEFGGGFGETTSVLIEGDDLATPEAHNALFSFNK